MTTLVLYVGITVSFLTIWGVIMVGSYLLGGETDDSPMSVAADWVTEARPPLIALDSDDRPGAPFTLT